MTDRSKFLGATDIAAVLGVSPWTTPLELWQEKTGRKAKDFSDPKRAAILARGKRLEPIIVDMAVDKLRDMGLTVAVVERNRRYTMPDALDFLSCEIDFELIVSGRVLIGDREFDLDHEPINGDAKSVTGFARKKWGDVDTEDIPIEYAAQFMQGLAITGKRFCVVAALRSFDDVDIFWCVRDDETIEAIRTKCVQFWHGHVLRDIPPDPVNFDDVKALFPVDNGLAIEASEQVELLAHQFLKARAARIACEKEEDDLKFELTKYIAPHTRLTYQGADLLTWKGQSDTRLDQEALRTDAPELFQKYLRTKVIRVLRAAPKPKRGVR